MRWGSVMKWFEWAQKLWESLTSIAGRELGAVIAAAIVALGGFFLNWLVSFVRWLVDYHRRLNRAHGDVGRVTGQEWPKEGKGLWLSEPINPPDVRLRAGCSSKVLVVANAKGGVGKTTVASNVAARLSELAAASGAKPVLLIDLDFQGTLSAMSVYGEEAWLPENGRDSDAAYLISGDLSSQRIASTEKSARFIGLSQNPKDARTHIQGSLRLITSYYDLAQAESRLMVEWLIGDRKSDLRFGLRKLLWSDAVASAFSAVVIDCPPRFTTAAIQAFAAATHILIPTKLDFASREAVISFARQIELLRNAEVCWKDLKYVGVVATMVDPRANVDNLRIALNDKLALPTDRGGVDGKTRCIGSQTDIHESTIFRDAGGRGIAYLLMGDAQKSANVKSAIQRLTLHIAREMDLPHSLQEDSLNEGVSAA
jgi:chromosome partitioning protein